LYMLITSIADIRIIMGNICHVYWSATHLTKLGYSDFPIAIMVMAQIAIQSSMIFLSTTMDTIHPHSFRGVPLLAGGVLVRTVLTNWITMPRFVFRGYIVTTADTSIPFCVNLAVR